MPAYRRRARFSDHGHGAAGGARRRRPRRRRPRAAQPLPAAGAPAADGHHRSADGDARRSRGSRKAPPGRGPGTQPSSRTRRRSSSSFSSEIFLKERVSPIGVGGLVIGFVGIVVMVSVAARRHRRHGRLRPRRRPVRRRCDGLGGRRADDEEGLHSQAGPRHGRPDGGASTSSAGQPPSAIAFAIEGSGTTEWASSDFWAADRLDRDRRAR